MSKAYKGKTCVYCAIEGSSNDGDHIFAREFFPIERRANLPKVPACPRCNNAKSQIEHYMTTVLPFAGRHKDASHLLAKMVPRRLAKNRKLFRDLVSKQGEAWIEEDGFLRPTMTLPIDANQIEALVRYIIKGLVSYHWKVVIPSTYLVGVAFWTEEGERLALQHMPSRGKAIAQGSWGNGAFEYRGVQAFDDPFLSIWMLKLFGGALVSGDPQAACGASSRVWVSTAQTPMPALFNYE